MMLHTYRMFIVQTPVLLVLLSLVLLVAVAVVVIVVVVVVIIADGFSEGHEVIPDHAPTEASCRDAASAGKQASSEALPLVFLSLFAKHSCMLADHRRSKGKTLKSAQPAMPATLKRQMIGSLGSPSFLRWAPQASSPRTGV